MTAETVFVSLWLDVEEDTKHSKIIETKESNNTRVENTLTTNSFYRMYLKEDAPNEIISEKELVNGLVHYIGSNLGTHLDETLTVECRSVIHGSLELFLAISVGGSLTGNVLGNTKSLIENINAISKVVETLANEWMWRGGYNAPSIIASPASRLRNTQTAQGSDTIAQPVAGAQSTQGSTIIAISAAILASLLTAIITYTLVSQDIKNIGEEVSTLKTDFSYMKGQIGGKP